MFVIFSFCSLFGLLSWGYGDAFGMFGNDFRAASVEGEERGLARTLRMADAS